MTEPIAEQVLIRSNDGWRPTSLARGPFAGGLHGGIVGAMLSQTAEDMAQNQGLGICLSAHLHLLKSAPVNKSYRASGELIRKGGRMAVIEVDLMAADEIHATARFTFAHEMPLPNFPLLAQERGAPGPLGPPRFIIPKRTDPWFLDTMTVAEEDDGTLWLRIDNPAFSPLHPMAHVICIADWSSGFDGPARKALPVSAFPNIDLTVHLWRHPRGEWIGLEPHSRWRPTGHGVTTSLLRDAHGSFGFSNQLVLLYPQA